MKQGNLYRPSITDFNNKAFAVFRPNLSSKVLVLVDNVITYNLYIGTFDLSVTRI